MATPPLWTVFVGCGKYHQPSPPPPDGESSSAKKVSSAGELHLFLHLLAQHEPGLVEMIVNHFVAGPLSRPATLQMYPDGTLIHCTATPSPPPPPLIGERGEAFVPRVAATAPTYPGIGSAAAPPEHGAAMEQPRWDMYNFGDHPPGTDHTTEDAAPSPQNLSPHTHPTPAPPAAPPLPAQVLWCHDPRDVHFSTQAKVFTAIGRLVQQ
jgi:hypothetical protein